MACGVVTNMGRVFNTWKEVEEVLDAFNAFMRPLARPEPGLEDYGDVAIFSIASGKVVVTMNWSMGGGGYVLEKLNVEFNEGYCTSGYCRFNHRVGRAYDAWWRGVMARGLARLASRVVGSSDGSIVKYVIGGVVITLEWVGDTLWSVSLEATCPSPGNAGG